MRLHKEFEPASYGAIIALETAAEEAARRIRVQGWPKQRFWPPLASRSRVGTAHDPNGALLPCSRFRFIDGSGPWLGRDGALYWRIKGNAFYRRGEGQMTLIYDEKRVAKVIGFLAELESK